MAFAGSGWFTTTFVDVFDTTQLAIDLDLETHKVALFNDSITQPNFDTDTAYGVAPYDANEIANSGNYTTGGTLLLTTTFTASAGVCTFDAANTSWASSTISNAEGCLIYADALAGNNAIILIDFGAPYSTSNGTFEIQWPGSGIGSFDIVP